MRQIGLCSFTLLAIVLLAAPGYSVTIPTVRIGNPDNSPDTRVDRNDGTTGYGPVSYSFRMGRTEVTNSQYVEFLNAVAASDPYQLYSPYMNATYGGILRSGSPGSYSYAVKPPRVGQGPGGSDYTYGDKPVNYVSWLNAVRFANWLHNGQGSGDTESGAYTLRGPYTCDTFRPNNCSVPSNVDSITRNPDAHWWVPSEDEWYKAAYYDPQSEIYYEYPTGSNTLPDSNLPSNDTGNSANINPNNGLTDAGAYAFSASPYGTFDQAGNVYEWNESLLFPSYRGLRGGMWACCGNFQTRASERSGWSVAEDQHGGLGFRVATIIPEPCTSTLLGFVVLLGRCRFRRWA